MTESVTVERLYQMLDHFQKSRWAKPYYLVCDSETFRRLNEEMWPTSPPRTTGLFEACGLRVVVIPSDGLECMKIVALPWDEVRAIEFQARLPEP